MYRVSKTLLSKRRYPELHAYFKGYALLARNLYNAALFRLRQTFTMKGKDRLSANEQQVLDEIQLTMDKETQETRTVPYILFPGEDDACSRKPGFLCRAPDAVRTGSLKSSHPFHEELEGSLPGVPG